MIKAIWMAHSAVWSGRIFSDSLGWGLTAEHIG